MAEILPSVYKAGTATVAANGLTVTGQGTLWIGPVLPGDFFGVHKGLSIQIESVDSNGSLTLANPWPGAAQNAAPYAIMLQSDVARYSEALRQLLVKLSSGNVDALAGLVGAANKMPVFTGAGTMAAADISALALSLMDDTSQPQMRATLGAQASLGFSPIEQGGGTGQGTNKIYLGYSTAVANPRMQVDNTDFGRIWTDLGSPNVLTGSGNQRFPNGIMIQWGTIPSGGSVPDFLVPFPVAFAAAPYAVVTTASSVESVGWSLVSSADLYTASAFAIRRRIVLVGGGGSVIADNSGSPARTFSVSWVAIGRWF